MMRKVKQIVTAVIILSLFYIKTCSTDGDIGLVTAPLDSALVPEANDSARNKCTVQEPNYSASGEPVKREIRNNGIRNTI